MSTIKLLKVDELNDGTQRFQSQLLAGKDSVDFIMGKDGVIRSYGYGKNGFDFYQYNEPYEIVTNLSAMATQIL